MFQLMTRLGSLAAICFVGHATAGIVVTTDNSGPNTPSTTTDETVYNTDVSTTDLLNGLVGVAAVPANTSIDGLNDGVAGVDGDADPGNALNGKTWVQDGDNGTIVTYVLGTGANGLGYDITEVQSIASWPAAGFNNQHYFIGYTLVSDPTPQLLIEINFQPFNAIDEGGASKVNITDDSGPLLSGADSITFYFWDTTSDDAGGAVYNEIDVFGTSTLPEPGSLALLGFGGLMMIQRRRRN